jgi:SPP1 gp7 family putative phage head morphogenesis protein
VASQLEQAAARFKGELERRERGAFARITRAYNDAYRRLGEQLADLNDVVEQARLEGRPASPSWLYRQERYISLQAQLGRELAQIQALVTDVVGHESAQAIGLATMHARGLVETTLRPAGGDTSTVMSSWADLNVGAIKEALAFQSPGSPLTGTLESLVSHGLEQAGAAIVTGITTGQGPRAVARELSRTLGANSARALTIVRTETMRAYREATRQSYLANRRIVTTWTWQAALDRRTCACCYAMHGTEHPLEEQLDGHPSCRCVMLPNTPTWAQVLSGGRDFEDIGETNAATFVRRGDTLFERLPPSAQRDVLGPGKLELYRSGRIELADVVQRDTSPAWGTTRREASIKQALDNADRRAAGRKLAAETAEEEERRLATRLEELDGRFNTLIAKVAPQFEYADPRKEQFFRNIDNGKVKRARSGRDRAGRIKGSSSRYTGMSLKRTVADEARLLAEREVLRVLAKYPENPLVIKIEAELAEAREIRERLLELTEQKLGF